MKCIPYVKFHRIVSISLVVSLLYIPSSSIVGNNAIASSEIKPKTFTNTYSKKGENLAIPFPKAFTRQKLNNAPPMPPKLAEEKEYLRVKMENERIKKELALKAERERKAKEAEAALMAVRKKTIVVIDPGHGGSESGAEYGGVLEKNLNLDIALKVGKGLEQTGITVLYTRKTDVYVSLSDRAELANSKNANLFISIHNNALPENLYHRGTETLFTVPPTFKTNSGFSSMDLASIIQRELVGSLNTANQGIKYRPNLAVLRKTHMPAIIAEVAFMSNFNDRKLLTTNSFRQNAAKALDNATIKALKAMRKFG